jgi:3,4-dihydroxy 2-butanone 4-phosphate synthase/GTP cyclohydrolase II
VVEQVPIEVRPHAENIHYLRTKRDRMGHALTLHHQDLRFGDDWEAREG